ncbi:hypothetical protein [Micromonospora sp. NPDC005806]|uniref:hypothetical protein n=1 Tax=Micromonospora sp. NPDC005806 TaxID=3364234 RepID=UPI00367A112B
MTVETRGTGSQPIRADELKRRDQVLLFAQVIEVFDVQSVLDFPTCVNLVIRPVQGGTPRETLVPRDMLLLGMRLPRLIQEPCQGCGTVVKLPVDLAQASSGQVVCGGCRGRIVEGTARVTTQPVPVGRY